MAENKQKKDYSKISKENAEPETVVTEPTVEPTPAEVPVETKTEPKEEVGVVVDCVKLNVRKKPNVNAEVECIILAGTVVSVAVKSTKEFYKVTLKDGTEGFCMKKYIKITD